MAKAKTVQETIQIDPLLVGEISVWIRGTSPLICNRLARKAQNELLFPKKKTKPDKEQMLKHNPLAEYRTSVHSRLGDGPTRLMFPAPAIKGVLTTAALETKGTTKAQIGRLTWIKGYACDLYGVPQLHMSVVRMADINKTPDIRTRSILAEWCMPVTIQFVSPQLNETNMLQLLSNGGVITGIGDWRQAKLSGNYGQFTVVQAEDCKDIIKSGGLKQQDAALKSPTCFDAESEELLAWFMEEVKARGKSAMLEV